MHLSFEKLAVLAVFIFNYQIMALTNNASNRQQYLILLIIRHRGIKMSFKCFFYSIFTKSDNACKRFPHKRSAEDLNGQVISLVFIFSSHKFSYDSLSYL